jgi:hypothetical protein
VPSTKPHRLRKRRRELTPARVAQTFRLTTTAVRGADQCEGDSGRCADRHRVAEAAAEPDQMGDELRAPPCESLAEVHTAAVADHRHAPARARPSGSRRAARPDAEPGRSTRRWRRSSRGWGGSRSAQPQGHRRQRVVAGEEPRQQQNVSAVAARDALPAQAGVQQQAGRVELPARLRSSPRWLPHQRGATDGRGSGSATVTRVAAAL